MAAAIVPELRHQAPTLLQRATKIAAVGPWDASDDNYFWLPNRQVLLVTQSSGQVPLGNPNPVQVQRLDPASGLKVENAALETALSKAHADALVDHWQLSPDAKWLLAKSNEYQGPEAWVATTLDGTRQVQRPYHKGEWRDEYVSAVWRPDSRSWIQAEEDYDSKTHVFINSLSSPIVPERVEDFMLNGRIVVGFPVADRVLALYHRTGDGGGVGFVNFGGSVASAPCSIYYEHIPPNMDIQEVALSPDGQRLAWKMAVKPLPLGLQAAINSSYVRRSSPTTVGLWTSLVNCSDLYEVGTLDARDDHVSGLRWTPDGKRLSFIDDDTLYTVPAD